MGYLSLDDAARVCSMVFKCQELAPSVLVSVAVPVDPINYSLCVHWLAAPMPPDRPGLAVQAQTFECIAQSTTCNAASSCLSEELIAPTDPRCADAGTDGGERCADDGGTVENCAGGYLLHCGAAYYATGSHCLVGQDNARWCALDTNCTVSDSCIGTINDFCGDNVHESVNGHRQLQHGHPVRRLQHGRHVVLGLDGGRMRRVSSQRVRLRSARPDLLVGCRPGHMRHQQGSLHALRHGRKHVQR
jgi:hypothetical protein